MNTLKNVEKLGRQAWLASLGAYGTSFKYAVEKFDQTYTKTNALFSDLVSEGEKLEHDLQEKLKAKELLDAKIIALKTKLGLNEVSETERLKQLTAKVDDLTTAVTKLVESRKPVESKKVEKVAKVSAKAKTTAKASKS